jgi:hypothetical protein
MDGEIKKAIQERLTVSVVVAGKALGMGRNKSYAAAKSGALPCIDIHGKKVCPTAPLRRLLGLDDQAAA